MMVGSTEPGDDGHLFDGPFRVIEDHPFFEAKQFVRSVKLDCGLDIFHDLQSGEGFGLVFEPHDAGGRMHCIFQDAPGRPRVYLVQLAECVLALLLTLHDRDRAVRIVQNPV